jgi:sugar phosphate isomerase/epimerase
MKPAICTSFDATLPFVEAMTLIRQAGFEVVSIGARPEHSEYHTAAGRAKIKRLAAELGLGMDSVHAPFPEGDLLCSLDEGKRLESIRQCQTAIDAAQDLDAGNVVLHLDRGSPDPQIQNRIVEQGFKSLRVLASYALARGVQLALENGMGAYNAVLARFITEFTDAPFGFCYDSGHENVDRTSFKVLETYGPRLCIVHLHDNSGEDSHRLPYEGDTDWPRLMGVLRRLGYSRSLLLEADLKNSQFKDRAVFLAEARQRAAKLLTL